jgi:hypothetical protein
MMLWSETAAVRQQGAVTIEALAKCTKEGVTQLCASTDVVARLVTLMNLGMLPRLT